MLITEQHFKTVLRVVKIKLMDTSSNEVVDYIFMNGILLKDSNNKHTTVRDYRLCKFMCSGRFCISPPNVTFSSICQRKLVWCIFIISVFNLKITILNFKYTESNICVESVSILVSLIYVKTTLCSTRTEMW